ncbi:hypothetical protein FRB90_001732 [Tulasnella sp. 427]|nr:hypothetical protein FRB90_001732 [Tulasnella sp. 427]
MAAVLRPNAPASGSSPATPSQSQPPPTPPAVATSAPPQHKSFRQMARAQLETLRTVTRSKGKNKANASVDSVLIANENDFKSSLGLSSSTAKLHKDRDRMASRDKGKEKEPLPRASIDTTASQVTEERPERSGLRRLTSRTGLSFGRKSTDGPSEASTSGTSRTRTGGGWPSFMTHSQSTASISTPALHLNSDPNNNETHVASPTSSVTAIISPPRARRPTVSSRDGSASGSTPSGSKKPPPTAGAHRQAPPSPAALLLASSSKNPGTSNKNLPASPSTPSLPSYSNDIPYSTTPSSPKPIIRRSTEIQREPLPRSPSTRGIVGRGERSASRSGSGSGSDSRSVSPVTPPNSTGLGRANGRRPSVSYAPSQSPTPRRSSDRRSSFEQRTRPFGSISASHLPLGAAPSSIPSQHSPLRTTSRERHVPSPIVTGPPSSSPHPGLYQQRRNSSSASFTRPSSPPSSSAQRAHSPVYRSHARNQSSSSLAGVISPQRESMRAAASFIVKEMSKPTPATLKANPPYGGLAGAPGGVKAEPWIEVETRLAHLVRVERVWGRSGFSGMGTIGNASSVSVDATGTPIGGMTVSGGGEERERRVFCEALRDGYVLAQLMNKLNQPSSLRIPLVDPREDGFSKTSNILRFRDIAREYITKSGPEGKELAKEMFGKDDLAEGKIEGVARVSRVIAILASLKDTTTQPGRWISGKERRDVSVPRTSMEIDVDGSMSGSGTLTPGLSRSTATVTNKRISPPSPILARSTTDLSDSLPKLDRRQSSDRHRKGTPSTSFATPPTPPPARPSITERRSSGGHYQLGQVNPSSPPPAPPRSLLRNAPSFNSNRTSVASSAQTHATDHTNLFDNHRSSNRFGTIRTMNTIATDATSIGPDGSVNGSWGREDANNAMVALGLVDTLEAVDSAPTPPQRRRSYDLKGAQQSGLGLALQSHPPVSSADLFQEGGRPRRDRRSSEIAAATDLTRVLEDPEKEGSIRPKALNRRSSDNKSGLNFGKAKWPDDFVGKFNGKPDLTVSRSETPDLNEDPFLAVTTFKNRSLSPSGRGIAFEDKDTTPKGKASANGSTPITIVTAASRQVTPSEEKDDPNSLSPTPGNMPYRRPTHRAGSQSVDVLLPRTDRRVSTERRISINRRPSADKSQQLKSEHVRDSSSGSGESQTGVDQQPILRPTPLRRTSTRGSASRQAMYIPKRSSTGEDLGSSAILLSPATSVPAVASVPAVSHIRVPFPRTSSGEHQPLARRESQKPRAAFPSESESTIRDVTPPLPSKDESVSRVGTLNARPRHQSDLEATRLTLTRRATSNMVPTSMHRRGSHGAEDHNLPQRGRFDPSLQSGQGFASSTNLARASSVASRMDGNIKKTIIVREEGKAPMHYQLGNCIGRGQFGSVYRALNINTGQIVAVKRIRLEGLPESEITQLMKEVHLLKRLQHPSIVQYEGMVRDDDSLDIVLEYVENGSLGQTLKSFGKFNEKLVATYVTKILEGLHYLHEQQVVHCDLKAANILSTKNGNIKLSDFGVSLTLNAMENAKETMDNVAGTPNWMAPEVIELKGASTASDIWSLGCTIVELLTAKPPYSEIGNSLSVMFRIVEDDTAPIPEGCSAPLRDFLSQCFKKDPAERPTAEALFEHPWLKRTWGLNKDLRPDDSVPFLRRISTDLQARQLSIQNLSEVARTQSTSPASPLTPSPGEPEFVVKPHSFVKTTFSKPVTCKVCQLAVKKNAVLCEECSLICHAACAKEASSHCDVRAQLLLYSQYALGGLANGSPLGASVSALPSPLPPPSPRGADIPLSGSPSLNNKFFVPPWRRMSKASTPDATSLVGGMDEQGSQRRNGNFLFRRSEDRSRSRRDSMAGGSQHSASTRSGATRESQRSARTPGELGQSRISTITFEAEPEPLVPDATPVASMVNDPARRPRRSRKDSRTDSKDCVIQ